MATASGGMVEATRGHVFVVRGDLRALGCDAIGYSGGEDNAPSALWRDAVAGGPEGPDSPVDAQRAVRRWAGRAGEPAAYTVPVAGDEWRGAEWYLQALDVFLERVRGDLAGPGRVPRVAIPLLGGSRGAQAQERGRLLRGTLERLWAFAARWPVDVILVCDDDGSFDAAQWLRRQRGDGAWGELDEGLRGEADRLAAIALGGDMALFLGAGVSVAAGLPSWDEMLRRVAEEAGLDERRRRDMDCLAAVDRAQYLARKLGPDELRARVVALIGASSRPSLAHALLAALPVDEIVTTNYDRLFEVAAERLGRPVRVLPYEAGAGRGRWLMKLHGTVERAEDLVLSRDTFLQYEASRAALSGLLAGLMLTRHLVVVGSSFRDDNVLRITEQVQRLGQPGPRSRAGEPGPRLGTALAVGLSPVQAEMWQGDFRWVDLGQQAAAGGRRLEIFLDRVAAGTATRTSYLFDGRFERDLGEGDLRLRDALTRLLRDVPRVEHRAVGTLLDQLRERLGWRDGEG